MRYVFLYVRSSERFSDPNPASAERITVLRRQGYGDGGTYADLPTEAGKRFLDRPAARAMHDRLVAGDFVVVDNYRTAFGSPGDMVRQLELWATSNVWVCAPSLGLPSLDTTTQRGRRQLEGMRLLLDSFHRIEPKPLPRHRQARQAAFGWKDIAQTTPDDDERAFGLKVVELKRAGMSYAQVANLMNERGFRQPRTGEPIRADYVARTYKRMLKLIEAGI